MIECLKTSGLEIRDIARFMELCQQGDASLRERKEMFENRRQVLLAEIARLQEQMNMIEFKCWYYQQPLEAGCESAVQALIPQDLPEDIRRLYTASHQENQPDPGKTQDEKGTAQNDAAS